MISERGKGSTQQKVQPLKNLPSFMIAFQFIRVVHMSDSMTVC